MKTWNHRAKVVCGVITYSDVFASPVTLLPPVNRGRPIDLKQADKDQSIL